MTMVPDGNRMMPLINPGRSHQSRTLKLTAVSSYAGYWRYHLRTMAMRRSRRRYENSLIGEAREFTVEGYCQPCGQPRELMVDYSNAYPVGGVLTPNWRERLVCPVCQLGSRKRAAAHIIEQMLAPAGASAQIYLTEQSTPLYRHLRASYPGLIGSEYLPTKRDGAEAAAYLQGLRSEDLTA